MSGTVDEAVCEQAREAMVAARRAEHAVLETVRTLAAAGVAEAGGYRSAEALIQDLWRVDLGEARRLIRAARALCGSVGGLGESVEPACPAAGKAAAAGVLDRGHVRVIDEAVKYLERVPGIDPAALTEAEEFLVEHAATLTPRGLARVAAALIAKLDQDGIAPEDDPEPTDELRIVRRKDGSLAIKGRIRSRADVELLCETFDALSGRAGTDDERDLAQRYAETLLDLCEHANAPGGIAAEAGPDTRVDPDDTCGPIERGEPDPRHEARPTRDDGPPDEGPGNGVDDEGSDDEGSDDEGSDDERSDDERSDDEAPAGTSDGATSDGEVASDDTADSSTAPEALRRRPPRAPGRAQLTLSMPLSWLQKQIGYGLLADETPVSAAEVRRVACDAAIIPMVLGTRSEPLDVGRLSYVVPEPMRRAVVFRDRGCSFPGCRRRPGRCHAHHIEHWIDGGDTALDNCTLLCRFHHHLVHHGGWQVEMRGGRPWYTPPRWIDPEQRPRPGGPVLV
jgi:hypothetical protein